MHGKLTKGAALLAFVIGAMAIFSGGQVLLGKIQDYYVIDWLPVYNFIIGLLSAFFTSVVIWKSSKIALPAAAATFASHTTVMLVLQIFYKDVVAAESIKAMTIRMAAWLVVVALLIFATGRTKARHPAHISRS